MQNQYFTLPLFEAQAFVVRDVILGRLSLPSNQIMQADDSTWSNREREVTKAASSCTAEIDFQADYITSLMKLTDCPKFNIEGIKNAFFAWTLSGSSMRCRDRSFRSLALGTMTASPRTTWKETLDDSLACAEVLKSDT